MNAQFIPSIHDVTAHDWNTLCGTDYPFLRHEFFAALEDSGSTTASTGWQAHHLIIKNNVRIVFVMPLFLKHHSYGEYVFDWSWADALHRHGIDYYPKLLNAIPFTPATGPRWGIADDVDRHQILNLAFDAIEQEARQHNYSSCHWLFPQEDQHKALEERGYYLRTGCQYHWFNKNYQHFDDFLSTFNSRKRKNVKKERRRVQEQGLSLHIKKASEITPQDWEAFYLFYHLTYVKRSGRQGYLRETFFPLLAEKLSEHIVMVQALHDQEIVAAALYFKDSHTLYGRYWGCKEEYDQLHFEACYYQGIEYAIAQQLKKFDPGAQGEHKIQRGFTPTKTASFHWINNPDFSDAIKHFVISEAKEIEHYILRASEHLPFRNPL